MLRQDLRHLAWSLKKRGLTDEEIKEHLDMVKQAEKTQQRAPKREIGTFKENFEDLISRRRKNE